MSLTAPSRSRAWWIRAAAIALLIGCFAHDARAIVFYEDEFGESSAELALVLRTFAFLFAGKMVDEPRNPGGSTPAGQSVFDLRAGLRARTPRFSFELTNQFSAHYAAGIGLAGALNVGQGVAPPRWLPLRAALTRDGLRLVSNVDRLFVKGQFGKVTLSLGRQPVSFGRGQFWRPLDLVSTFSLTEVDSEFKPGSDAARLDWQLAERGALTIVAAVGELVADHDAAVALNGSAFLARYVQSYSRGEFGLLAGYIRGDAVLAADGALDVKVADLYAELSVTILTDDSLTPNRAAICPTISCLRTGLRRARVRSVVGGRYKPTSKITLSAEVYYNGFGSAGNADYLAIAQSERFGIGEITSLAPLYLGFSATWKVHPLVDLFGTTLLSAFDPSSLFYLGISYNVAQNVQLVAGGYFPVGQLPDPSALTVKDEFGLYPYFAFAELKLAL
ncbi:MAG: hypothetical protein H6707_02865 [Deltaproteobacteria bacterium]|nr:hypothetical protein [Deltaproteobacteria bacterium]